MVREIECFGADLQRLPFTNVETAGERQVKLEHTRTFHIEETEVAVCPRRCRAERRRQNPSVDTLVLGIRICQKLVWGLRGLPGERHILAAIGDREKLSGPDRHDWRNLPSAGDQAQ